MMNLQLSSAPLHRPLRAARGSINVTKTGHAKLGWPVALSQDRSIGLLDHSVGGCPRLHAEHLGGLIHDDLTPTRSLVFPAGNNRQDFSCGSRLSPSRAARARQALRIVRQGTARAQRRFVGTQEGWGGGPRGLG